MKTQIAWCWRYIRSRYSRRQEPRNWYEQGARIKEKP